MSKDGLFVSGKYPCPSPGRADLPVKSTSGIPDARTGSRYG